MSPPDAQSMVPPPSHGAKPDHDTLVFLGTYSDHSILPHWPRGGREGQGITVARWAAAKDRLELLHTVPVVNPAFMKYHPTLNVLYVLSECINTHGYLTAFAVDPAGAALTPLAPPLYMSGRSSCYISFDSDASHAVVANYWDGLLNVVSLDPSTGAPLAVVQELQQGRRKEWRQVVDRADHMSNRQDGPHAHSAIFHPSYNWLFVPDLGDNGIHQYRYKDGRLTHEAFIAVAPGDGPRHFVFHPKLPVAYSGCELKSQVQVFAVDDSEPSAVRPRINPVQRLATLPEGWEGVNYVGEIKIDASGSHVYVSNRGHDSVAAFKVDPATGQLERAGVDCVLGRCPRHFGLSACGRYAVVGAQDSDLVRVFRLCPSTGRLTECLQELDAPTPNFVLFAPAHAAAAAAAAPHGAADGASEAREHAASGSVQRAAAVAVCAN
ncbi:hypothetical protein Rsub_05088 [Raphidocelis subcapitata]|uniref:6-phosphogluconolactonase n=1 Tax=Raphidocelis subcapitata TaxID=307507 RepID=A0A2V0NZH1_9CHLO|nr:hypothetical protein Rsub_05088 [Raphidocelis subcapitata]|eukprot:GBF92719.1 hypothetical protein Rsub_05088 [Raphidocelis subcapitata]